MEPEHMRRLLLGGTALLVAGWLGQVALVAPAILGAVAVATLIPLTLVCSLYAVVLGVTRFVDRPLRRSGQPSRESPTADSEAVASGGRRSAGGAVEAD